MKQVYNQNNTNIISIFYIILMSLLVSSCATYNVGEAPLTEEEIANFQNANPNAYTINYVNDLEFDVTNTTFINPQADMTRWVQASQEFSKYNKIIVVGYELAQKNCEAKDMVASGGLPNKFSSRYKCLSYIDSSYKFVKDRIAICSSSEPFNNFFVNTDYFSHPCYPNEERSIKYCKTYSDLFEIYPGQKVSCQELIQKRDRALYKHNVDSTIEYQTPKVIEKSFDFADAEKKCTELGFKAKTEKFADCVIKLSR